MHWELTPKNPQIALLFRSWRHERQFDGFQRFKKLHKIWSKKGSLNMFVPTANVLVEGSTFWTRKIDVPNRHLLRAVSTPPFPLPKNELLSEETKKSSLRHSYFTLSNVRALRAITFVRKDWFISLLAARMRYYSVPGELWTTGTKLSSALDITISSLCEVKCWTIRDGTKAPEAAGTILPLTYLPNIFLPFPPTLFSGRLRKNFRTFQPIWEIYFAALRLEQVSLVR